MSSVVTLSQKLDGELALSSPPYPLSGFLELKGVTLPNQTSVSNQSNLFQQEDDELVSDHWFRCYGQFGRITHLDVVLSIHGDYCSDLNNLVHCLMFESNGPLNKCRRQYLGLMGASRYGCAPVIQQCEMQYAKLNGDPSWIKSGITAAPYKYQVQFGICHLTVIYFEFAFFVLRILVIISKLHATLRILVAMFYIHHQKLAKLNALLAHKPWIIDAQDIAELVKGDEAWTISELVQALVILVQYHYLASMYQGLCITPEMDQYFASRVSAAALDTKSETKPLDPLTSILEIFQSPTANGMSTMTSPQTMKSTKMEDIDKESETLAAHIDTITLNVSPTSKEATTEPDGDAKVSDHEAQDDIEEETEVEEDDENEQEENRRCEVIATLLKHQQDLLQNEDVVGSSETGFEESACLS